MSGEEKCPACTVEKHRAVEGDGFVYVRECTGLPGCVRATAAQAEAEAGVDWGRATQYLKDNEGALIDLMGKVDEMMAAGTEGGADVVERLRGSWIWSNPRDEKLRAEAADKITRLRAENERLTAELAKLSDPEAVHVNLLRGSIARPTWDRIRHVYAGESAARDRAVAEAVREAAKAVAYALAQDFAGEDDEPSA